MEKDKYIYEMMAPEEFQSHFKSKRDLYHLLNVNCKFWIEIFLI